MKNLLRTVTLAGLLIGRATQAGLCQTWNPGDVFVGIGNSHIEVYHNMGTASAPNYVLVQTLDQMQSPAETTGCAFDSASDLYTTNFQNGVVVKFDANSPHGIDQTITTTGSTLSPPLNSLDNESIVFLAGGDFLVGHADGDHLVHRYNSAGVLQQTYAVATENRGSDWIDLSSDQHTLFYTSEGRRVLRFDLSGNSGAGAQLTDFANFTGNTSVPGTFYALRLLPPGDGSGGLLVANLMNIKKLAADGTVAMTYAVTPSQTCPTTNAACPNEDFWFALNLDADGKSFWAGGYDTGNFYKFDIALGSILVGPKKSGASGIFPGTLAGICVKGQPAAVNTVVLSYPTGTTTQVATFNPGDTQNNHTWKATVNATTAFSLAVSAHEVVCDSGVACSGDDFNGLNNYRCRWQEYFSGDPQLPIGVPYSHNMCVYYRVENPPDTSKYTGVVTIASGYVDPPGTPTGTPFCSTLGPNFVTRFFRDPSSPPPPDAALNHSFAFDFTTFFNESAGIDPRIGGGTLGLNDYAVACRDTTGATATWLKPAPGTTPSFKAGSSINLEVRVTSPNGTPIADAAILPNAMPLSIKGPGSFVETLGTTAGFWTYDSLDNWYIATWKSPMSPMGTYALCVNSTAFDYPPFPGVCTTLALR